MGGYECGASYEHINFCGVDEDPSISIRVEAAEKNFYVEALAPLRFHLLRNLAFGSDANFCQLLRHCHPHVTSGGKSQSSFWTSTCGQLLLKEVKVAEASHLASMAGPFSVRLAEALRGEPSLLCEVFGLFTVNRRSLVVMRNLLVGTDESWQVFDVKGAAGRNQAASAPVGWGWRLPGKLPTPTQGLETRGSGGARVGADAWLEGIFLILYTPNL